MDIYSDGNANIILTFLDRHTHTPAFDFDVQKTNDKRQGLNHHRIKSFVCVFFLLRKQQQQQQQQQQRRRIKLTKTRTAVAATTTTT